MPLRRAVKYGLIALVLAGGISISIGFNLSFNFGASRTTVTSTSNTYVYDHRDDPHYQHQQLAHIDRSRTRIEIVKSKYELHLYEADRRVATFPCVFGGDPISDKRMEGDQATPEGIFHVNEVRVHGKWTRFIGIDYPTLESQQRFEERLRRGEIPQDASIGGEIGIHGVQDGHEEWIQEHYNWTLGCISLSTTDIIALANAVQVGTEVKILH
jgi:murein L,D-transpeptidase YafK